MHTNMSSISFVELGSLKLLILCVYRGLALPSNVFSTLGTIRPIHRR